MYIPNRHIGVIFQKKKKAVSFATIVLTLVKLFFFTISSRWQVMDGLIDGFTGCMIGTHAHVIIADAYMKGKDSCLDESLSSFDGCDIHDIHCSLRNS